MVSKKKKMIDEQIAGLSKIVEKNSYIAPELYDQYNIKRGLRNANGTGVLVGITRIGSVIGYETADGAKVPCEGRLYYRGINVFDLVAGCRAEGRYGFEEVIYLLLFGDLPNKAQLETFQELMEVCRELPPSYKEDVILKIPSQNIMNKLQRTVLTLYSYDDLPDDTSISNVLSQSINLIAKLPSIAAYAYQSKRHYFDNESLILHTPKKNAGTAENLLHLIRSDSSFTREEAEILDLLLVIHAEHGGGNNSSFATHVVSSSGTDTYSAIATAIGSLKGPKHGGANLMVSAMLDDIKANVRDWGNENELRGYITKILEKKAFNGKGLVYGMGHAVYTLSDPRAVLLKDKARELARLKGVEDQYQLIADVERIAGKILTDRLRGDNAVAANVDLYSGLVYEMLGIPRDLYTPLFAISRVAGWCAHRLEQILDEKIMRPAYITLGEKRPYQSLQDR